MDDVIGSQEQRLRDGEAECLGGLEVDDQLKLRGLLDGQIGGLGPFQNLAYHLGGFLPHGSQAGPVRDETPSFYLLAPLVNGGQSILSSKLDDGVAQGGEQRGREDIYSFRSPRLRGLESLDEVVATVHLEDLKRHSQR